MNKNDFSDKRKYVRVSLNIPVSIQTADVTIPRARGFLQDISATGAMFETTVKMQRSLLVRIFIDLDQKFGPLIGNVVWQNQTAAGNLRTGIKLDDSSAEQNDKVVEVVVEKIIEEIKNKTKK